MANKIVIGGSRVSAPQLEEVFSQIARGALNGDHIQALIEHRDPFKKYEITLLGALRASGYLDTSFEGKEVHSLTIRPLTKEQALDEYRNSGGKTWVWDELEKNMPYTVPKAEILDVMILGFGRCIRGDEALAKMDKLGVRPLPPEPLIQYGIIYPDHQKRNPLVSMAKTNLDGNPRAPVLRVGGGGRILSACDWGSVWGAGYRFPVVRK